MTRHIHAWNIHDQPCYWKEYKIITPYENRQVKGTFIIDSRFFTPTQLRHVTLFRKTALDRTDHGAPALDHCGPNLLICVLVMFLNRVFRQERFNWFLWFLASLIKNSQTLRNCYLFSCRYKNLWDIGMRLKPHVYKKCQQLRNPNLKTDFSLTSANKPESSLVLYLQFWSQSWP